MYFQHSKLDFFNFSDFASNFRLYLFKSVTVISLLKKPKIKI